MAGQIRGEWTPGATTAEEAAAQEATATTGPRCECGRPVDARTARVFGVDGVVPVCKHCEVSRNGMTYRSTVQAITRYLARGRGRGGDA